VPLQKEIEHGVLPHLMRKLSAHDVRRDRPITALVFAAAWGSPFAEAIL